MVNTKKPTSLALTAFKWLFTLWAAAFCLMVIGALNYYSIALIPEAAAISFGGALPLAVFFGILVIASLILIFDDFHKKLKPPEIVEHAVVTMDIIDSPELMPLNPLVVTKVHSNGLVTAEGKTSQDKHHTSRLYAQVKRVESHPDLPSIDEESKNRTRSKSNG